MSSSKDNQIKDVVTGLALGTLAAGAVGVTSAKMQLEFALSGAWREWGKAHRFAAVRGYDPGNVLWLGMHKSERRRGVCAAWRADRWMTPYVLYRSWTIDECLELIADERASVEDWKELGRLFVAELGQDSILPAAKIIDLER